MRLEAVEGRRSPVRKGKWTGGETLGTLWATTAAGPSHLASVSASPTPAQALQFKGHHRGGSCPYLHLIWPDPGLAAKLSLSCQHSQQQLHSQPYHQPPSHGLCLGPLEVSTDPHTHGHQGTPRNPPASGQAWSGMLGPRCSPQKLGGQWGTKSALRTNRKN